MFLVTRYASVASIVAALALPLFALLFGASVTVLVFTVAAALAVVLLHRTNIQRLRAGTEKRITLRRRRGAVAGLGGEPLAQLGVARRVRGVRELGADLADRAVALGEHLVVVDRLEVDLARQTKSSSASSGYSSSALFTISRTESSTKRGVGARARRRTARRAA